jgi:hypothetical protein
VHLSGFRSFRSSIVVGYTCVIDLICRTSEIWFLEGFQKHS